MPQKANFVLGEVIFERASMSSALIAQAVHTCENMKDASDLFSFLFSEEVPNAETIARLANSEVFSKQGIRASLGVTGEVVHSEGRDNIFYAVMDIQDIIASHDPNKGFIKQENYPSDGQERPYHTDEGEQQKVKRNALRLEPRFLLTDNPDAINGPPVVTGSGIVMGGNSRTMSLLYAYENTPEKAELYKKELREKAKNFGIPPSEVDTYEKPILVRVAEGVATKDLAHRSRVYNQTFTQGLDTRAEGVSKGKLVTAKTVGILAQAIEAFGTIREYLNSGQSKLLVNSLIEDGVIEQTQLAKLTNKEGLLNEDGKRLVEGVLRGKAIDDFDLLNSLTPAMMQKIDRIIAPLSLVTARGEEWDITPKLKLALWQHVKFVASGAESPETFWNQRSLFDEDEGVKNDAMVEGLFLFMANAKPTEISKAWNRYANFAMSSVSGGIALPGIVLDTPESAFKKSFSGMIFESVNDGYIADSLTRSIVEASSKEELYTAFLGIFGFYEDAEAVAESAAIYQNIHDACMDEKSTVMDALWAKDEFPKVTSNTVLESLSEDEDSQKVLDMMSQATPEQGVQYLQGLGEQYLSVMKQSQERFYALGEECKDLRAQLDKVDTLQGNEWWEAKNRILKENKGLIDSIRVREREIFNMTAKALIEASPISQEQAEAWIKNDVTIDNTASNFLTRIKYPRADFKRDLAEVYRIVGGKIGPVTFIHNTKRGEKRSYAHGTAVIAIQGEYFSKKILFHECGHLAENGDETFGIVCRHFIENRAIDAPQQLKTLTGIDDYEDDEVAYPDNFIHPYVGKIYPDGSEILSVGLETLVDKNGPFLLLDDPDYLKLITGICVHKSIHTNLKKDNADTDAETEKRLLLKSWTKAIEKVSGSKWGKKLSVSGGDNGYKGYGAYRRGATSTIYIVDGNTCSPLFHTKPAWVRAIIYLLIAEDEGIIPPLEGQKTVVDRAFYYGHMLSNKVVPSWFNPDKTLPEV